MPPKSSSPKQKSSVIAVDSVSLGTLALNTGVTRVGPVVTRGGRLISTRASMSIFGLTTGDGPWMFGVLSSGISLSELEAYLELAGPVTPSDRSAMEVESRGEVIRVLGLITPQGSGLTASAYVDNRSLSGLRFAESGEDVGWAWWIYNRGKAMETGATWAIWSAMFVEWNPSG